MTPQIPRRSPSMTGKGLRRMAFLALCPALLAACGTGGAPAPAATSSGSSGPVAPASVMTSSTPVAPSSTAEDAATLAKRLKVASATKVVALTEDTDTNNLLGRPNGYTSAAVVYDSTVTGCTSPGVDCGLTVEVWRSPETAVKRSEYIQGILKGSPALGSEYHALRGAALLRGSGKLKPSLWQQYQAAFTS